MTKRQPPTPIVTFINEPSRAACVAALRYTLARLAARKAEEGK